MEKYAVIMAGGSGSRLWPLSRENRPKQFIRAGGDESMLIRTLEQIRQVVPAENCFIITNRNLQEITRKTLGDSIPASNILFEPLRKNTAACISYSVFLLKERVGSGLACFFPADSYVKDQAAYHDAVEQTFDAAEKTGRLIVIGINPTYPATGYGYIHVDPNREGPYPVSEFKEKPNQEKAMEYFESGDYWWNSGIIAGNLNEFQEKIKLFLPEHYREFSGLTNDPDGQDSAEKAFRMLPDISFDEGVLEKAKDLVAVRGRFDWDDIGNLESLSVTLKPDDSGNRVNGKFIGIDTGDSVVYGGKLLVAAIGLKDMVIAVTDDAVLVCPKDRVQDVKKLVEHLKTSEYEQYT